MSPITEMQGMAGIMVGTGDEHNTIHVSFIVLLSWALKNCDGYGCVCYE
jgi:hypothetical protein